MVVTATQFKTKIGHYLDTVSENEVFISKNGKIVARLSSPIEDKQALLDSLVGITAHNPVSLAEAKNTRLARQ